MKYLTILLTATILFTGCKTFASSKSSSSKSSKPFCYEFKDDDLVIVPVSETRIYKGVIVLSDRNPDPCERVYLMLIGDFYNRPFFIHWSDVVPYNK